MELIGYPVRNKQKSRDIIASFLKGCGGQMSMDGNYQPGKAAVFWGVDSTNDEVWRAAKAAANEVPYFYGDNSYFDATRGSHYRFTRNALQHSGSGQSNGRRFEKLDVKISAFWHGNGEHIVVCEQSPHFMINIAGAGKSWLDSTISSLQRFSNRDIRLRSWNPDKLALARTLPQDLERAHALVTWSSAAAVEAVLAGVPIFCDSRAATAVVGRWDVKDIETPYRPTRDAVLQWVEVLADNQWSIEELERGAPRERLKIE